MRNNGHNRAGGISPSKGLIPFPAGYRAGALNSSPSGRPPVRPCRYRCPASLWRTGTGAARNRPGGSSKPSRRSGFSSGADTARGGQAQRRALLAAETRWLGFRQALCAGPQIFRLRSGTFPVCALRDGPRCTMGDGRSLTGGKRRRRSRRTHGENHFDNEPAPATRRRGNRHAYLSVARRDGRHAQRGAHTLAHRRASRREGSLRPAGLCVLACRAGTHTRRQHRRMDIGVGP
ncbi:MAG: hypothetical protein RJB62_1963 [Pseudomonadota bacterium]